MKEQQTSIIDYYVWLLSDWAYLGGVRFVQLAARHGLKINHIPMRMQDVYAGSGGILLANRLLAAEGVPDHRIEAMALPARYAREHRAQILSRRRGFGLLRRDCGPAARPAGCRLGQC